ncbi:sugar phosphate isomerase/epimerase family protein [Paenibacillus sp. GCM10023248]|uniref:sugar phosphate isomerase/epimerase family protein n=1 Tax=unclassified Paenibacillus TaxID=185978 RepID=UPI002379E897|nr:sugar phosphate isomerase/epimerase [Paenibacillus sp. MAHUQ-63]MDD9269658.1 sugar phosphate isomerase/epimerase [Paenibacillus sp. MAHUQ-63]
MRFGLTAYGTVYAMGIHPAADRKRITAKELLQMAESYGLQGSEIPYDILQSTDADEAAEYARDKGLFINVATGGFDPGHLKDALQMADRVGALTVRTVVGGAKFGGDRRHMVGSWQPFLQSILRSFQEVMDSANPAGANLAVENHQDLASEELLWLCENISSKKFGITLDTGNPLATAEEPVEFFRRVAPYVKNVHLKEYAIYSSEEGYRLVRKPLGQGVINFPELLGIFDEVNPQVTMSVEHGALEARHVRVLQEDFWNEYPERSARQLTGLLRFVKNHARNNGDWQTPFEKGAPADVIAAYELEELNAGITYLSSIIKRYA